jgi:hypothetical protein
MTIPGRTLTAEAIDRAYQQELHGIFSVLAMRFREGEPETKKEAVDAFESAVQKLCAAYSAAYGCFDRLCPIISDQCCR